MTGATNQRITAVAAATFQAVAMEILLSSEGDPVVVAGDGLEERPCVSNESIRCFFWSNVGPKRWAKTLTEPKRWAFPRRNDRRYVTPPYATRMECICTLWVKFFIILPPITIIYSNINVSWHIFVSRYICIRIRNVVGGSTIFTFSFSKYGVSRMCASLL
jgi:hypothetical protein